MWPVTVLAIVVAAIAAAVAARTQGVKAWQLLAWAAAAGAATLVTGLIVPAAISRRERHLAAQASEQAAAAVTEDRLRMVMRPVRAAAGPNATVRGQGSPSQLLRPERRAVGFAGRNTELRTLRAWAHGAGSVVQLITGPGGSGKTRLAIEFATQLEEEGWRCGFLYEDGGGQAIAAIAASGVPTLLIVDYAEARADLEALLRALARHSDGPDILVLLLARTAGDWWQPDGPLRRQAAIRAVTAEAETIELSPVAGRAQDSFRAALTAFADHYDMPVPAVTLRPAPKSTPPLLLHVAALTTLLDMREGKATPESVAATQDIVEELIGHESRYWSDTLAADVLNRIGAGRDLRRQIVALAGLLGAADEEQAAEVLRRLPALVNAPVLTMQAILRWLREVYPADGSSWLGSIQPDLLLEYLVTSVFASNQELVRPVLANLPPDRAEYALTVLARALDHYPALATLLLRQLLTGHTGILALASVRLTRNLDSRPLGQAIADALADKPVGPDVLRAVAKNLDPVPASLASVAVVVYTQMGVAAITNGAMQEAAAAASALTSVGQQLLVQQNLPVAAENVNRGAVALWQALADVEPGGHRLDLALALVTLARNLTRLGHFQEALRVSAMPVNLLREVEKAEPGRHRIELAETLANQANALFNLGHFREGLPSAMESVEILRAIEKAQPGTCARELGAALKSYSAIVRNLGQLQESLEAAREAVGLFRDLYQADPVRYRPYLADTMKDLSYSLSLLGRPAEALPYATESVRLFKIVDEAEPGGHRAFFADSLRELAAILCDLGQARQALPYAKQSVAFFRLLEQSNHDSDSNVWLADCLRELARSLRLLGRDQEALANLEEAASRLKAVEQDAHGDVPSRLASVLLQLTLVLDTLGRQQEALPHALKAMELYRALKETEPDKYITSYLEALSALGTLHRHQGDMNAALSVTRQSVREYRALTEKDREKYSRSLAAELINLSGILLELARIDEAENVRAEADFYQ